MGFVYLTVVLLSHLSFHLRSESSFYLLLLHYLHPHLSLFFFFFFWVQFISLISLCGEEGEGW